MLINVNKVSSQIIVIMVYVKYMVVTMLVLQVDMFVKLLVTLCVL